MQKLQQLNALRAYRGTSHDLSQPILELQNVSVRYNGRPALDDITFQLQRGERVAIIGPNGAGKSSLFNVISGVLTAAQGRINVYGNTPGAHTCIAYVPQRSQADWEFPVNVADVVMMGRVGKLGLFHWPKRQIGELSGGQQQRVFIARALAQEAELMLLDEPLTGLDVKSQDDIFAILDKLRQRQVTILVATHDLNLAAEQFDRLMLLNQKIIGFGRASEVFTSELLNQAYSGHMRLIETPNGVAFISDTCCGGGETIKG